MLAVESRRTYEGLRRALVSFHSLRQGEHLSPPEDSLGVQRVPQSDASFETSSNLYLDAELALRCPSIGAREDGTRFASAFECQEITFAYLTHGGTYRARDLIAKKWPPHSAGAIHRIADETLLAMVRHCGGRCKCAKGELAEAEAMVRQLMERETRVKALVERWRSRYGTSRDACADELETTFKG